MQHFANLAALRASPTLLRTCLSGIGLPCSGKGKQAKPLQELGFFHDSMGDHCRSEIQKGNNAYAATEHGKMVPDPPILEYIQRQLAMAAIHGRSLYYPDGWNRNVKQLMFALQETLKHGYFPIFLLFTTPPDECIRRAELAAKERTHRKDNHVVVDRIIEWAPENELVFQHVRKLHRLKQVELIEVDNTGLEVDETTLRIFTQLDQIVGRQLALPKATKQLPGYKQTSFEPVVA